MLAFPNSIQEFFCVNATFKNPQMLHLPQSLIRRPRLYVLETRPAEAELVMNTIKSVNTRTISLLLSIVRLYCNQTVVI